MDDLLLKIQPTVQKYMEVLSSILGIDVEVMSKNKIRVAGTGLFLSRVGERMDNDSRVYMQVIATKDKIIIQDPGRDPICETCPQNGNCPETFEIAMPIFAYKEVFGVIGMLGTTKAQKDLIESNLDGYLEFIEQIAYFIGMQISERIQRDNYGETNKLLYKITDNIEQGILIFNSEKRPIYANSSAKKQLSLEEEMPENFIIKSNDSKTGNHFEYSCRIEEREYTLVGEEFTYGRYKDANYIFMFHEKSVVREKINAYAKMMHSIEGDSIIGVSKNMIHIKNQISRLSKVSSTILITGESGVGKEVVAKALWKESKRKNKKFVAVNCAAIPEALMESELFGYVKGSFTGANTTGKKGKFEYADQGTLFLDEIGDMPLYLQAKLLRVLQEKKITPVGSNEERPIDVRVISATNKNLKKMVEEGTFRADLYYRLNVIPIKIEPLRQRVVDIEVLITYFLEKYSGEAHICERELDETVLRILKSYRWPGNVRELQNVVEFIVAMSGQDVVIDKYHLPEYIANTQSMDHDPSKVISIDRLEKKEILKALDLYGDSTESKHIIARELGIGLSTLYRKMIKYKLS